MTDCFRIAVEAAPIQYCVPKIGKKRLANLSQGVREEHAEGCQSASSGGCCSLDTLIGYVRVLPENRVGRIRGSSGRAV